MAHRRNYQDSRDREQPQGWFDPENFARNRERTAANANRPFSRPEDDMRRDLPRNQGQGGQVNYGRANYVSGHDASSSFPNYRNIEAGYSDDYSPGRQNEMRDRGNYGSYDQSYRYNEDRRFNENYGSDRNSGSNRYSSGNWRRENDRRHEDHDRNDRDWWDRTTDEVASWFGDEDAERRRRMDKMSGPHSGKGPKGYTRSDEKIREDINERLYQDSYIDASEIEVEVSDGEAKLTGTVDNKMIKRRVEDIVESVAGVKDVENHLKVTHHETSNTSNMYGANQDMTRRNWS